MKLLLLSILLFFFSIGAFCQNYTRDAGIRFGNGFSISLRQFTKEDVAAELFLSYYDRALRFGGLKQHFTPAFTQYSDNFRLYYGYGVHGGVSYTNKHKAFNRIYRYDWTLSPLFGMDGIAGLEYYFPDVPILVSGEVRPYFEFSTKRMFLVRPFNMSLSVKYRF